jgi:hypothetical protein
VLLVDLTVMFVLMLLLAPPVPPDISHQVEPVLNVLIIVILVPLLMNVTLMVVTPLILTLMPPLKLAPLLLPVLLTNML